MEAHGALAQPAVELVRTLADRIAPRRAFLDTLLGSVFMLLGILLMMIFAFAQKDPA